jgi:hypothetical protein
MGSFTDSITQFNPYVAQLPIDAMVKVGMQKQQQYEEGVKKIQSQIDQVAGLDVLRDVDKNYLQSKLNDLGKDLRWHAASDFSNFQTVNAVGGMTKQISKDRYVQAAVSSSANHRKQLSDMEEARKKGTLTPDNEYHYSKQLGAYLGDDKLKSDDGAPITFSGKYVPFFDVFKYAKETFDAVKPDGFSFDQVYETDANGNPKVDAKGQPIYSPTMIRMEQEGIFPEKVKQTLGQVFSDPRVAQQLSISGQYTYRNMTSDQLSGKIIDQKENIMSGYSNQLRDLNLQKNSGKDVQKQIDAVTQQMNSASSTYDDYAKSAFDNPDGVKGQLYKDDVNSRYTTMFGWVKKKEQNMENPGWNANFKLMQEANDAREFEQTLHQRKLEHADDMAMKRATYEQTERLALLKSKKGGGDGGAGTGPGGQKPVQADQPSAIDKIQRFEQTYTDAANTFKGASDEFLWNNVFSGVGKNDTELTRLVNSGMNRNAAMSLMIDNAAKGSKQDPIDFRATWGNKAEVNYSKMTPQQKAANPSIKDTYTTYRSARKNFDAMASVKAKVDKWSENNLNAAGANSDVLRGIYDEQTVKYNGVQHKLSKQDVLDMAVYIRGNQSTFGFANDKGAKTAATTAYQRLKAKGLADVADYQLDLQTANPTMLTSTPITGALRTIKAAGKMAKSGILHPDEANGIISMTQQVKSVYDKISNDEYESGLQKKAAIIDQAFGIKPNLKVGLMSDDVGTNKVTLSTIKNWSGAYKSGQTENYSSDFKNFASYVGGTKNLEDANLEAQVIVGPNNVPQVEIVAYDANGDREGGMTVTPEEAGQIGIDVNALYESKDVSILRNKISYNGNKTCEGNPKDATTYINGDVYYDRADFAAMGNAPFDVSANIIYRNGVYYPVVYASNGTNTTAVPRELPGSENLQQVELFLKQSVNPTLVQSIITESAALNR